jgi:hypothetical protein
LHVLWNAHGSPAPDAPCDRPGRCARCGTADDHASRIKAVVSDKFTGWDLYTDIADPLWCRACAWGHTTMALRVRPWLITAPLDNSPRASQTPQPPTRPELTALLSTALPHSVALTIPISRQKHILPAARWGYLTTDDRVLRWDQTEATRFHWLRTLRTHGFSETSLREPAPRFEQLITLAPAAMRETLTMWDRLGPWRADDTYLSIACIASRPPKEPDA